MKSILVALLLASTPAHADISTVINEHILPGHAAFVQKTDALVTATEKCSLSEIKPAYNATFDAWLGISHLQFGPMERGGISLSIAFWPDPKNQTEKALNRLISVKDAAAQNPKDFAEVSVAAQGFFAMERLLFEPKEDAKYSCVLMQAIAKQLAANAVQLDHAWTTEHAQLLRDASAGNDTYHSEQEAKRVLYTSLSTGLEFLHGQRLGRPLGRFDRPRPARAEARRSGRSIKNIQENLVALQGLAQSLSDAPTPRTDAAFTKAIERASTLNDDLSLQGTAVPSKRIRIEALQQFVAKIQEMIIAEIGTELGVRAGFNSMDGD